VDDGYSGFEGYSPDGLTLEAIIRPHNRYERVGVIIGGLATDYCDLATVIDATKVFDDTPNVNIAAVSDAMRAVDLAYGDGDRALEAMQQAGALVVDARSVLDHQVFIKEDRA
jgi:nicotinamidase-related amidase